MSWRLFSLHKQLNQTVFGELRTLLSLRFCLKFLAEGINVYLVILLIRVVSTVSSLRIHITYGKKCGAAAESKSALQPLENNSTRIIKTRIFSSPSSLNAQNSDSHITAHSQYPALWRPTGQLLRFQGLSRISSTSHASPALDL